MTYSIAFNATRVYFIALNATNQSAGSVQFSQDLLPSVPSFDRTMLFATVVAYKCTSLWLLCSSPLHEPWLRRKSRASTLPYISSGYPHSLGHDSDSNRAHILSQIMPWSPSLHRTALFATVGTCTCTLYTSSAHFQFIYPMSFLPFYPSANRSAASIAYKCAFHFFHHPSARHVAPIRAFFVIPML
ncbi:hypothetical protein E4T42_00685 [Aureobasidium subglaciale]|nr:hypothetical protein E4T42_00685 [Aureobasidium subglaciale]